MNRRQFLKKSGTLGAGIAMASSSLSAGAIATRIDWTKVPIIGPWLLKKRRSQKMPIAAALDTPEGRQALARSMIEPIKASLEYQSIGRKLIMIDELPETYCLRYQKDIVSE